MNLNDLFDLSLAGDPSKPALDVDGPDGRLLTLTFGDVDRRAARTADVLLAHGVTRGDRVAVYLANRLEFLDLFLACLRLGAVFVPVNVLYKTRELTHILADADPRVVITTEAARAALPEAAPVLDLAVITRQTGEVSVMTAADGPGRAARIDSADPAAIIYTSGTTGRSKGAVLSHGNFVANTAAIVTAWRITSADRYLAVLPLFHVHGLANGVCAWLATGCRMRLVERFDRDRVPALFEDFAPTLFFGVPTMYVRLLDLDDDRADRIGKTTRLFVSGSAPLPAPVHAAFQRKFGHAILERYGMSETLMLISNPYAGQRRAGTVGAPLPGVHVRLVDPHGDPVPEGKPGQVLVRGANVFAGYWRNPAATAAAFDAGWFRTGDMAERSADGYYTLQGRATDLIITGGFNVYPREIEDCLLQLPGVREAVVVGSPDAARGEVPIAYVVAAEGFDAEAAREACLREMASFKVPRAFVQLESLPRNALGKVQKHLLPRHAG